MIQDDDIDRDDIDRDDVERGDPNGGDSKRFHADRVGRIDDANSFPAKPLSKLQKIAAEDVAEAEGVELGDDRDSILEGFTKTTRRRAAGSSLAHQPDAHADSSADQGPQTDESRRPRFRLLKPAMGLVAAAIMLAIVVPRLSGPGEPSNLGGEGNPGTAEDLGPLLTGTSVAGAVDVIDWDGSKLVVNLMPALGATELEGGELRMTVTAGGVDVTPGDAIGASTVRTLDLSGLDPTPAEISIDVEMLIFDEVEESWTDTIRLTGGE